MRIEFFLTTVMEIGHICPILRALDEMGVDAAAIVAPEHPATMGALDGPLALALLQHLALPHSSAPNPDADMALTIQESATLCSYRKLKARLMYGVGIVPPLHQALAQPGFDFYFVHGPLTQRIQFTQHSRASAPLSPERVKVMGYPRFDDWFNARYEFQLPRGDKPTLLWLPTWQERSSIDAYVSTIFDLSDEFDIIVKPHHCTFSQEPERLQKLMSPDAKLLNFTTPAEWAFEWADHVLADISSGAFAEAILARKHVVALAQPWEIESLLLPSMPVPICTSPTDLLESIRLVDYFSADARAFRAELFDTTEGHDAARAASLIVNACNS